MSSIRRMQWTAWLSWVLAWGLGAAGLILWAHNGSYLPMVALLSIVTFQVLGVLIVSRQPRNRIGWIFCVSGLLSGLWLFTSQYAVYALITEPGSLPGAAPAAWLSSWSWAPPNWLVGTLCLLLFPDGHLPSRHWRPIPWLATSGLALFLGALSVMPWAGRPNIAGPHTGPSHLHRLACRHRPAAFLRRCGHAVEAPRRCDLPDRQSLTA